MTKTFLLGIAIALSSSAAGIGLSHADCSALYAAAQQHAYDMARRNSLDHAGFKRHRGPAGAVAENVAVGCETEDCARRRGRRAEDVILNSAANLPHFQMKTFFGR